MSLGGGYQSSDSSSNVWQGQKAPLKNLYSAATNFFNQGQNSYIDQALQTGEQGAGMMPQINQQTMSPWKQQLQGGMINNLGLTDFYNNMMDAKGTVMNTLTGMQDPSQNPYLKEMGQYGLDMLNENFARNVMPQLTTDAAFSGGLGGSRQGIAQGTAAGDLAGEQANYLSNFMGGQYQGDMNRAAQAAQVMGGLQQNAAGAYGNILSQQDTNAQNALRFSPQMLQNFMAPSSAYAGLNQTQWSPYANYSQVLGQPTVLSDSSSKGINISGGLW